MKKISSRSPIIIVLVVLAVILVFSSLFGSSRLAGYNLNKSSLNGFQVEPFTGVHNNHYASYPSNATIDAREANRIDKSTTNVTRVHGFDGLYGSSDLNNDLDVFKSAPGTLDENCHLKSSGLSNSRGYLCLDNNQIQLLRTRGGNQSGRASDINGSSI